MLLYENIEYTRLQIGFIISALINEIDIGQDRRDIDNYIIRKIVTETERSLGREVWLGSTGARSLMLLTQGEDGIDEFEEELYLWHIKSNLNKILKTCPTELSNSHKAYLRNNVNINHDLRRYSIDKKSIGHVSDLAKRILNEFDYAKGIVVNGLCY